MAANILIYGNDIGDTARNDLARAQIMDQRSRDAMGGMRQTSQFLQNKGLQQDALQVRRDELGESKAYREQIAEQDRLSREQIAKDQRQAQIVETTRRALDARLLDPDSAEGILEQLDPMFRAPVEGMIDSARRAEAEDYAALKDESDALNTKLKDQIIGPAWYRSDKSTLQKNRSAAASVLSSAPKEIQPFLRFNEGTMQFEPAVRPPKGRTYQVDPMSIPSGGGIGAPGLPADGQMRMQQAPPQQGYAVDPMMIPQGGGGPPMAMPQAVPSGPPVAIPQSAPQQQDLLADPADQQILQQLAQQFMAQGVDPQTAYIMAMDRLVNQKRAALQQPAPAQEPLMHNPMRGDPLMPGIRPY